MNKSGIAYILQAMPFLFHKNENHPFGLKAYDKRKVAYHKNIIL